MNYDNCIILGNGQLASECAKVIKQTNLSVTVFDTNKEKSQTLEKQIQKQNITYIHLSKKSLFEFLGNINKNTLLISAVNPYIIPENILNNPHITAINLHHALLPRHPGRNAEAWAIYEEDNITGITWHNIVAEVDAGKVLIQNKILLNDTFTSLKLLKHQHSLAVDSFLKIVPDLLTGKNIIYPQPNEPRGKLHYSWDIPNQGYIDMKWTGKKLSAFLRAMDYGILETLGKPKLLIKDDCFIWRSYKIEKSDKKQPKEEISFSQNSILIHKDELKITLSNYSVINQKQIGG